MAPLCQTSSGPSIAIVFAGTNDALAGTSASATVSFLAGEIQTLKSSGCTVFVGTMLSRANLDSVKDTYDALVLEQSVKLGATGIIDFAAEPLLGADNAFSNTTWFNTDQTHPTQTGQNRLGVIASNALNYYFGFNQANSHIITSASYTMLAGDGYIARTQRRTRR